MEPLSPGREPTGRLHKKRAGEQEAVIMGQTQFEFQPAPRGKGDFKEFSFVSCVGRHGPQTHWTRPDQPFPWAASDSTRLCKAIGPFGQKNGIFPRRKKGFLPSFHCTRKFRLFFADSIFFLADFINSGDAVNFRPGRPLPTGPECNLPPAPGRTARSLGGPLRPRSSARGRAGCSRQIRCPTGL